MGYSKIDGMCNIFKLIHLQVRRTVTPFLQDPQVDERLCLDGRILEGFQRLEAILELSSTPDKAKHR